MDFPFHDGFGELLEISCLLMMMALLKSCSTSIYVLNDELKF